MAAIPAFHRSLTAFKRRLSTTDEETFALTTFEDLKTAVKDIQQEQAQRRGYRNLTKIKPFLVTLQQYALVIEQFVNAKSDFLAFIWIASRLAEAFDWLLDAYARIGESLPVFSAVDNLFSFHRQDYVEQILANVYEDILSFHQRAVIFFKQSTWTIAFKTTFRTFNDLFGDVAKNLQRSKELLIQSASVIHFQEAQDARLLLTQECSAQRDRHQQHQRLAVVSWLSHTPCDFLHAELRDTRHKYPDTTRWIFDTVQISEWLRKDDSSSPILWLCGIPGAGKTILFSSITDHIKTNYPNAQIIYFYCKEKDPVRDNFIDVARSLITQILELNPICIHYLYEKALNSVERSLSSMVTCTEILSDLVLHHSQLFIGIDGLDECEELERSRILAMLHRLLGAPKAKLNVQMFLASRKDRDIGNFMESANRLEIRPFHLRKDINSYVRVQVGALSKRFDLPAERQKHIVTEVTMRADGMFLLARLIMDNLLDQICHEDLEEELRSEILPKGINQAYGRILFRMQKREHSTRRSEISKLGLDVLTMIKRPIKVREIQAALSIRLEDKSIDLIKRRSTIPIAELLGPMVEVHADNSVNFIHSTARKYLLQYHSEHYVDPRVAELRLARLCTSYLTFQCFDPFLSDSGIEDAVRRGDYAFQEYATFNWIRHMDSLENHSDSGICDGMSSMRDSITHLYSNHIDKHTEYISVSDSDMTGHDNPSFAKQLEALRSLYDSVDTIHCNEDIQDLKPYLLLRLVKVRAALEGLSPKELKVTPLVTEAYGESLYKCHLIYCNRFCQGFANRQDRDEHVKRHERAHKCTHEGCDYSELGFPTSSELTRHICLCHSVYPDELAFPSVRKLSNSQALKDAIDRDDAVAVRGICGKPSSRASSETGFVLRAVKRRSINAAIVLVELLGYAEEIDHKDKKGATALHEAITIDHRDLITRILNTDVNVNALDGKANTPFILALKHDNLEAARLLLNHHAIDLKPPNSRKDLEYYVKGIKKAACSGGDDILRAIFETMEQAGGFAVPGVDSTRRVGDVIRQALVLAARYRHESTVKLILESWRKFGVEKQYPEPIRKEVSQVTDAALRAAMKLVNIPMIQLLLEVGADLHAEDGVEGSALSLACARGHTDIIRLLLEEGAFVDIKIKNPYRPLLEASSHGHQDIVQLLIEHKANVNAYDNLGETALHKASTTGQKDVVILLLEKGADINSRDRNGYTALHKASTTGQKDVVIFLLEKGADIDLQDRDQLTALHQASAAGKEDVVILLLENGADLYLKDYWGQTALHQASAAGKEDVVMLLLEKGVDLYLKTYRGQTALHRASVAGSKAVVMLLLEKGVDIDLRDGDQLTALHQASAAGKEDVVMLLLEKGADLYLKDYWGQTALHRASAARFKDVVILLLEKGADINSRDRNGCTALHEASRFGDKAIVKFLLDNGADLTLQDEQQRNALYEASHVGTEDVVQLLLEKATDVELPGGVYDVALNKACNACRHDFPGKSTAQLLLEKGATFDIALEIYNRALKTVKDTWNSDLNTYPEDMMQLLREKGARLE